MSVEQGVFALAGAVCVVGSVIAVAHRDPRVAGAALLLMLLSLGALYATLSAPLVGAIGTGGVSFVKDLRSSGTRPSGE